MIMQMMRKVTTMMVVSSQTYSAIALLARVVERAREAAARGLQANIETMIPGTPSTNLHFAHANRCAGLGNASTAAVANEVGEIADNV